MMFVSAYDVMHKHQTALCPLGYMLLRTAQHVIAPSAKMTACDGPTAHCSCPQSDCSGSVSSERLQRDHGGR